jgi:outer membrane lipoprotein-sorting protein
MHYVSTIILFTGFLFANTPTVDAIQDSLISRFSRIEDYTVNIKISVKMTGLRMPRKKIKLFYKAPDKIKVKSRGFAIVPKTGLGGSPEKLLNMFESIHVVGNDSLKNRKHWLLTGTVIPDSMDIPFDNDNIPNIIMNLWVDAELWAITKAETIVDSQKVFQLVSDYAEVDGIFLPSKTTLSLGFKGLKNWTMHEPFGGPMSDRKDFKEVAKEAGIDPDKKEFAGTVVMEFSKYKVNKGLDDKLFKD